tara:strand:- start:6057 stop:6341 length:285 start_codon:yes stop_codon:yes gene_type:complete
VIDPKEAREALNKLSGSDEKEPGNSPLNMEPEGSALDQLIERWESIVQATERDCAISASAIAKKGNLRRLAFFKATLGQLRELKALKEGGEYVG